jgi:hypothetical protein
MTARVLGVTFSLTESSERLKVAGLMSAKTGVAPV